MTNSFVEDCKQAIKELNDVVAILERQEEFNKKIDEIGMNEEQKRKFAEIFYRCGK